MLPLSSDINPMGTNNDASRSILAKWETFCSKSNHLKHKRRILDDIDHELQTDMISCGCIFMEKFVTYNYNFKFNSSKENLNKIRKNYSR